MPDHPPYSTPKTVVFVLVGVLLYWALALASESLLMRNGAMNPVYKIEMTPPGNLDLVVLGASHAMPLDLGGMEGWMEADSGSRILNLAGPGTGPLYNRFLLQHLLARNGARKILYVADSFAFLSPLWNEDRFTDPKLLAHTPFVPRLARILAAYVLKAGVDPRALLDYLTSFSKINDRDRFVRNVWEGEATFDRSFPVSTSAIESRIAYLYPEGGDRNGLPHYLAVLHSIISIARDHGASITIAMPPLPAAFRDRLPDEALYEAKIRETAEAAGASFVDWSRLIDGQDFYADTDHLNRKGVGLLYREALRPLISDSRPAAHR